ncbi:MAG: roadblock/LC7 domain-containing protein [Gemmatimonadales bacterium]
MNDLRGGGGGAGRGGSGAASWSFREEDASRIGALLERLLAESSARTALLVDRAGQMLATAGQPPQFDPITFATLTAADFSANDQLARLLGENEFGALFHQGERDSLYLADIARRVILVVLFDNAVTTLGLVKLRVRGIVGDLAQVFTDMFSRESAGRDRAGGDRGGSRVERGFIGDAEDEIDRLFGSGS